MRRHLHKCRVRFTTEEWQLTKVNIFEKFPKQTSSMKPFIRTAAVVLPLFFLAACNPSKAPGVSTATITASPNPVPTSQGVGTTTITWNTGDGTAGQVYVESDGKPEVRIADGPTGSKTVPWIVAGQTAEFHLYAGTEHTKMLAKTQVTGQK